MAATANGHAHANGGAAAAPHANGGPAAVGSGDAAARQLLQEFLQVQEQRARVYALFQQGFREFLAHGQEQALAQLMHEVTPAFNAASQQVIQIEGALKSAAVSRPDLATLLRRVQDTERQKLRLTLSWQALRAAHAAGRFSWQAAADRPRAVGAAQASAQARQQQQQQQLLGLLQQLEAASASSDRAQQRQDSANGRDQGQQSELASVKPGFYSEQMQRAVEAAAAGAAAGGSSSSHAEQQHGCVGHHACQHHHGSDGGDPLEPTEAEYTAAVREALQQLNGCVSGINEALDDVRDAVAELAGA